MSLWRKLFSKSDDYFAVDQSHTFRFILKIDDIPVGYLETENGYWKFYYSDEFKNQNEYRRLTGFSDLNKTYKSEELWPFFKTRIPGLKQPMIQEIIEKEKLDKNNEAALLRRFGNRTMTNPYILEAS